MAYTEREIRAVRLLIPDTEPIFGEPESEDAPLPPDARYMFPDSDIEVFLDQGQGNAKWAAGLASLAIGGSEALIGKWIRNYETQTNGAALQKEWTAKGKLLIEEGRNEVDVDSAGFFIVAHPEWGQNRHPEGMTHGAYRAPTPYQW